MRGCRIPAGSVHGCKVRARVLGLCKSLCKGAGAMQGCRVSAGVQGLCRVHARSM